MTDDSMAHGADDDLEPIRRSRPDRLLPDDPPDPAVLSRGKARLMSVITGPDGGVVVHRVTPSAYPRLAYRDEAAALEFLTRVFGLVERREFRMELPDGMLAWLEIGDGVVMIGRSGDERHGLRSPLETGAPTAMVNVYVPDIDAHYQRAESQGAQIVMPLEDMFWGDRRYEVLDCEGHRWHFAERMSDVQAAATAQSSSPSASRVPHPVEVLNASYTGSTPPPWDIGRPQPAFIRLAQTAGLVGRVLDVGCGTGEHALLAASLGHKALGVDLAPRAIELARAKAADRGLDATFLVHDVLHLPELGAQFDTVLDCGLFHSLDDEDREQFIDGLAQVLPTGGQYHMLCFSDREPGDWGPRRITEREIRTAFAEGWAIVSIEPAVLDLTIDPSGALAWQVTVARQ